MKWTIFFVFSLGLIVGIFSYPPTRSNQLAYQQQNEDLVQNSLREKELPTANKVTLEEIEDLCLTIVKNQHLNDIFSDIIGLNLNTLSNEIQVVTNKLIEIKKAENEKIREILMKTSFMFKLQAAHMGQKVKVRLVNFLLKGNLNSRQRLSNAAALKQSINTFLRRLITLVKTHPNDAKKEDVVVIFETFLDTKLTSTVRDQFDDAKIILGVYFIMDQFSTEFLELAKHEGPEIETEIKAMYAEFEGSTFKALKPLIQTLKPVILPPEEPEFDMPLVIPFQTTQQPQVQSTDVDWNNSEYNEIS